MVANERAKLGDGWPLDAVPCGVFGLKGEAKQRDRLTTTTRVLKGRILSCSATDVWEWLDLACSLELEGASLCSCLSARCAVIRVHALRLRRFRQRHHTCRQSELRSLLCVVQKPRVQHTRGNGVPLCPHTRSYSAPDKLVYMQRTPVSLSLQYRWAPAVPHHRSPHEG